MPFLISRLFKRSVWLGPEFISLPSDFSLTNWSKWYRYNCHLSSLYFSSIDTNSNIDLLSWWRADLDLLVCKLRVSSKIANRHAEASRSLPRNFHQFQNEAPGWKCVAQFSFFLSRSDSYPRRRSRSRASSSFRSLTWRESRASSNR